LIESDPGDAELVQLWLRSARESRYDVWHVETLGDAEGCLAKTEFDLALVDLALPDAPGPWAFQELRERHPDLPVIVFSSFAEADAGARLLDEGARDHLIKGQMNGDTLLRSMRHGVEHGKLLRELRAAQRNAQDSSRVRAELVAELAQECRTPIHTVLGMADLLLETQLTREQEGYVRSFLRASETLLARIDGLLGSEALGDGPAPPGPALSASPVTREAGLSILVVDDSRQTRERTASLLRGAAHSVEEAPNGRVAVEMFRAAEFDLVLMDMQMPELNGHEACRAIRRLESEAGRSPVPILAVTGRTAPEDVRACLDAGCDDHLAKPVDPDALLAAVDGYAPKHHGRLLRVHGSSVEEIDLYLHERHNDLAGLRFALEAGDLGAVSSVARELERTGQAHGFREIAALGSALERAACDGDRVSLERGVKELADFLREVKIVVG